MIVAHETGHKSSLQHSYRGLSYNAAVGAAGLGRLDFIVDPLSPDLATGNTLVDFLADAYRWPVGSANLRIDIKPSVVYAFFVPDSRAFVPPATLLRPFAPPLDLLPIRQPISGPRLDPVGTFLDSRMWIEYQRGYIMDWSPRPTFVDPTGAYRIKGADDWIFAPVIADPGNKDTLANFCIKPVCP